VGLGTSQKRWKSGRVRLLVGLVPLVAYALSFIISLSGVSRLVRNHRELLRVSVGGSEEFAAVLIHPYSTTKSGHACSIQLNDNIKHIQFGVQKVLG
jgi:hypothetical protein